MSPHYLGFSALLPFCETPSGRSFHSALLVGSRNGAILVGPVYPLLPGSASLTEPQLVSIPRLVESRTPLSCSLRRKVYVTQPIGGAFNPDFSPASTPYPPTASAFLFRYIPCLGSCRLPSANLLHCLKARLACVFLWVACSNSGWCVGLSSVRALISFILRGESSFACTCSSSLKQ